MPRPANLEETRTARWKRSLGTTSKSSSLVSIPLRRPTSPRAGVTLCPPRLSGNMPAGQERLRRIRGVRRSTARKQTIRLAGLDRPVTIGQYAANPWGFYDMQGNAREFTADWYEVYSTASQINPTGPPTGSKPVVRGGSWFGSQNGLRSSSRNNYYSPSDRTRNDLGFRLACRQTSPPPPITDANFTTAINMWFSDEANATRTYGHISDWNVSGVTNMQNAFKDRTTFNENITAWGVTRHQHASHVLECFFIQSTNRDWNVSSVSRFAGMFNRADAFNQKFGIGIHLPQLIWITCFIRLILSINP